MGFDGLLGNARLRENLSAAVNGGHISHCYLISGPEGSGKHTLARLLAAAILCTGAKRPCLSCPSCRKVLADAHPDYITVDDPEKKTVPVELIRRAKSDIYIQPNESAYKIYQFPRANDMGIPGQNALLKVLEEPPSYGVFLLLADNPHRLLPTVRSRCVELSLQALPEDIMTRRLGQTCPRASEADIAAAIRRSGGWLGQAQKWLEAGGKSAPQTEGYAHAFAGRDALGLLKTLVPMEKWKRDALADILQEWLELTEEALAHRTGGAPAGNLAREMAASRSGVELTAAADALQKAVDCTRSNVSPAAVCGYLEWALR